MNRRNAITLAVFVIVLIIGAITSDSAFSTEGLAGYLADSLWFVLSVVGILLLLALPLMRHDRAAADESARDEAGAWEVALQEVAHEATGTIFFDATLARNATLERIADLKLAHVQTIISESEQPSTVSLTDVLAALKAFDGTTVRALLDHLKEHDIEVPGTAKAKQEDGQSLLAWVVALRPPPSPEKGVHGAGGVHERRSQSENGHEREGESGGGGEG